jgi:hypothetical protein
VTIQLADAAIVELEAEKDEVDDLREQVRVLSAELAALKEMLRLAWGAATDPFNAGRYLLPYEQWLAELQRRWTARAEEGGGDETT